MWYGKDTKELIELKKQYEEKFGYDPDGDIELEYGADEYDDYFEDMKEAIKRGITMIELDNERE